MGRKLIIDGNAVYEIDEECMLKNKVNEKELREQEADKQTESEKNKRRE